MNSDRISELEATCVVLREANERLQGELKSTKRDTMPSPPPVADMSDRQLLEAAVHGQYVLMGHIRQLSERIGLLEREVSEHGRTLRDVVPDLQVACGTIRDHGKRIGSLLDEHSRNHPGAELVEVTGG